MDGREATTTQLHRPDAAAVCWPPEAAGQTQYASSDDYVTPSLPISRGRTECPGAQYCDHDGEGLPSYYLTRGICEDRRLLLWERWVEQVFGWDLFKELFCQRGPVSSLRDRD